MNQTLDVVVNLKLLTHSRYLKFVETGSIWRYVFVAGYSQDFFSM